MARRSPRPPSTEALAHWAENQRALARTLGLSIEEWIRAIESASKRTTGLTAAVVGAAMARGLGLSVLDGLDGEALGRRAVELVDPRPPRVANPLLKEAIRRASELGVRTGARRLKGKAAERVELPTPVREVRPLGGSAEEATPDAPGRGPSEAAPPSEEALEVPRTARRGEDAAASDAREGPAAGEGDAGEGRRGAEESSE